MNIVLVSNGNRIDDDLIYFRYALTLADAGFNVSIVGRKSIADKIDSRINAIIIDECKSRLARFGRSLFQIKKCCLSMADADTVFLLFTVDLTYIAKDIVRQGAKVILVYMENYYEKIMSKKWIPVALRPLVRDALYTRQIKTSNIAAASIFVDHVTMEKFGPDIKTKKVLLPNYPLLQKRITIQHDFSVRPVRLVYVGGISRERGLETMLSLCKVLCDEVELHLFGIPSEPDFQKLISEHSNVFYHGVIPHTVMLEELSRYDIGLFLPQRGSMFNYCAENTTKIFEYMRSGLPIICTDLPGLKKIIVEDSDTGICVETDNLGELVNRVRSFISYQNIDELNRMSSNGMVKHKLVYNWSSISDRLINVVKSRGLE